MAKYIAACIAYSRLENDNTSQLLFGCSGRGSPTSARCAHPGAGDKYISGRMFARNRRHLVSNGEKQLTV